MENVADALGMAGAVFIFVLALSITILSFGQAREAADTILDYRDRETTYIDGSYYYETSGTERSINLETIIPSIFRAYLENYKIVFEGLDEPIYYIKHDGDSIPKYTLDLETNQNTQYKNVVLANDDQKAEFLCGILYNDFRTNKEDFERKFNITLPNSTTLYEQLASTSEIREYLGIYYQNDSPDMPDVNKVEKRIITYKIQ